MAKRDVKKHRRGWRPLTALSRTEIGGRGRAIGFTHGTGRKGERGCVRPLSPRRPRMAPPIVKGPIEGPDLEEYDGGGERENQ